MMATDDTLFVGELEIMSRRKKSKCDEKHGQNISTSYSHLPVSAVIPEGRVVYAKYQDPVNFGTHPSHEHSLFWHKFQNNQEFLLKFQNHIEKFDCFSCFNPEQLSCLDSSSSDVDYFIWLLLNLGVSPQCIEQRLVKVKLFSSEEFVVLLNSDILVCKRSSISIAEKCVYAYICSKKNLQSPFFAYLFAVALGAKDLDSKEYDSLESEYINSFLFPSDWLSQKENVSSIVQKISVTTEALHACQSTCSSLQEKISSLEKKSKETTEAFEKSNDLTLTRTYAFLKDSVLILLASVNVARQNPAFKDLKTNSKFDDTIKSLLLAGERLKDEPSNYQWLRTESDAGAVADVEWVLPALSKLIGVLSRFLICLTRDEQHEDPYHVAKELNYFKHVFDIDE